MEIKSTKGFPRVLLETWRGGRKKKKKSSYIKPWIFWSGGSSFDIKRPNSALRGCRQLELCRAMTPDCSSHQGRMSSRIPAYLESGIALKSPEDLCWPADTPVPKCLSHFHLETALPWNAGSDRLRLQSTVLLETDWYKNSCLQDKPYTI